MTAKGSQNGSFSGEYPAVKLRKLGIWMSFEKRGVRILAQSLNGARAHLAVFFYYKFCCFEVFLKASSLGFRGDSQHPLKK